MNKNNDSVLISLKELQYLKACEKTLYFYHRDVELCPLCNKGMLIDGFVCPHCGYGDGYETDIE